MIKDLQLIPGESGTVEFSLRGDMPDSGLAILQRIYVLLLSDNTTTYRDSSDGPSLTALLEGGNIPPGGVLNSRTVLACSTVLDMLDEADRSAISKLTGSADDSGNIYLELTLADGTTLTGEIPNE